MAEVSEAAGINLDLADVKPSLMSAIVILAIVIIGIPFLKFIFTKYPVPGLSDLVQAV